MGFSRARENVVGATLKNSPACGSSRAPAHAFPSTIEEVTEITVNAGTRNRIGQLFIHGGMNHQSITGSTEGIRYASKNKGRSGEDTEKIPNRRTDYGRLYDKFLYLFERIYVFILYRLPEELQVFLTGSLLFINTILYRYRLINRRQPVPVRFSRPELVVPHLESALDEHAIVVFRSYVNVLLYTDDYRLLRSRESNPRHARSLLVTTPRRWPFPFGPTVLGGFRTTTSQKNT